MISDFIKREQFNQKPIFQSTREEQPNRKCAKYIHDMKISLKLIFSWTVRDFSRKHNFHIYRYKTLVTCSALHSGKNASYCIFNKISASFQSVVIANITDIQFILCNIRKISVWGWTNEYVYFREIWPPVNETEYNVCRYLEPCVSSNDWHG